MMSSASPLVSVIIPVYNDREGLEKCLGCLARQTEPASHFEVIVIDNGSDIPIEPATALPNLKVIRESRPGSYAARNRGLELACGSLVAFTDADCLPRPDWIARGIAVLEEFRQPVSIGGRINIVPQFPARPRAVELYEQALVMVQSDLVSGYGFAATANMWTTRQTFDAVGLFDPARLSGGDAQWGLRVREAGFPVLYADEIVIDHPARQTWGEIYRKLRRVRSGRGGACGPVAPMATPRRSFSAKLARFAKRTYGWPLYDRLLALAVAIAMEFAIPFAELDLRWRRHTRL